MMLNIDQSIIYYLGVVIFLILLVLSMKLKNLIIFKIILKTAIGGLIVFAMNILLNLFQMTIPLNLITSFLVGVLGIPGLLLIFLIKYIVYPL
ncbi:MULTISPECIES: pro-sigmaK processing inhibitor BofA family protein [unclassified Caloramator]|uniref:pro-sigmaK processing inhibitor BofA family protein n=1 Tax=unclassified Caloramator TaxID=2629145 RepID=UPI00237E207E|nr:MULTISPECIES: pro-sigmaK processing inhibitor BofA family protein [unclassified Caloramator]MDO6353477.1 pro-sigmaK processing inhibitor BofA family protein [Caloramator sp. CAR-1]WDU83079.1 pro-sigmaK processing inhibitor BofA family protein [Caloramator sp. Dgby_cultured_2]